MQRKVKQAKVLVVRGKIKLILKNDQNDLTT